MKRHTLVETLESRRLLHADLTALVHFQPEGTPRVNGYATDFGYAYGLHRGGLTYGWSADARADAVDRNVSKSQKVDTFIAMQQGGDKTWSMAVENGAYQVYVFAGDAGSFNDRMGITVEGQVAVSGITRRDRRYLDGTVTVNVTDGQLTLGNAGYAVNNKIDYVVIQSVEANTTTKTLAVTASRPTAKENGQVYGQFTVTRAGDTKHALTVPLTVGGTATNGVDYGTVGNKLPFAVGVSSVNVKIRVADDGVTEGDETVTLTLGAVTGYVRTEPTATVTILDHASTARPTNVAWSTKAARPVAASEIFGAAVGTKVYTFGGFVDSTYHPTRAAYAYDAHANTWSRLADLPVAVTHAGVADDGSRYIYYAGGYPGNGANGAQTFSTTAVYRYDTVNNTYTSLPGLPAARGAGSLALLNGKLYFAGGDDSGRHDVTTTSALDLNDLSAGWVTRASVPASRNHAAFIGLGGYLYYLAGQTGQDAALTTHNDTYRYDPTTNAWTTVAALPGARSHVTDATFVYNGKIVVIAGQSAYNTPISSVLEYDPSADAWATLASLPAQRFSGVGGFADGKFVYAAGYSYNFVNTTYVGTLS